MKKQLLFALVLIVILLLATGSAAAKATKEEFEGTWCEFPATGDPIRMWTTGNGLITHIRGLPGEGYARSLTEPLYNAHTTTVANLVLNSITGSDHLHATFVKDVEGYNGGWEGTSVGVQRDGVWTSKVAGHGTGDLAGMKYSATFVGLNYIPEICPDGTTGAAAVTGVIHDSHGE